MGKSLKVKIPIFTGRILLYLLLKHITGFPQDPELDLKRLFTDYEGEFGSDELKDYFFKYCDRKKFDKSIIDKEIDYCFPKPKRAARGSYKKS